MALNNEIHFFFSKMSHLGASWIYFCQVSKKGQITTLPIKGWMLKYEIKVLIRNVHLPNKNSCTCCNSVLAHWAPNVSQEGLEHKSVTIDVLSCSPFFMGTSPSILLSVPSQWEEITEVYSSHCFNLFSSLSVR